MLWHFSMISWQNDDNMLKKGNEKIVMLCNKVNIQVIVMLCVKWWQNDKTIIDINCQISWQNNDKMRKEIIK